MTMLRLDLLMDYRPGTFFPNLPQLISTHEPTVIEPLLNNSHHQRVRLPSNSSVRTNFPGSSNSDNSLLIVQSPSFECSSNDGPGRNIEMSRSLGLRDKIFVEIQGDGFNDIFAIRRHPECLNDVISELQK